MKEQSPLNVLDEKQVEISHPAVVKLFDGSIFLPEEICLAGSPKGVMYQQDADAPDGGSNDERPDGGDHALPEPTGLIACDKSSQACCAHKEEKDIDLFGDAQVVQEHDSIIRDGEQESKQEADPDCC